MLSLLIWIYVKSNTLFCTCLFSLRCIHLIPADTGFLILMKNILRTVLNPKMSIRFLMFLSSLLTILNNGELFTNFYMNIILLGVLEAVVQRSL